MKKQIVLFIVLGYLLTVVISSSDYFSCCYPDGSDLYLKSGWWVERLTYSFTHESGVYGFAFSYILLGALWFVIYSIRTLFRKQNRS
ncbi:MAG: hypothetical protein ACJAZ2_001370 [Glaciecola sp.]|jgi:hypothetical protein